jgi:energy-coupling factor transporter ATP-binding protein EcfA2
MGHIEVAHLSHLLPDGRVLLGDASFRIGEGTAAALAGPNGAGKTTLIRIIAGDLAPQSGTVSISGGLGVMRQFIGGIRRVAPPGGQDAGGGPGEPPLPASRTSWKVTAAQRMGSRTPGACGATQRSGTC